MIALSGARPVPPAMHRTSRRRLLVDPHLAHRRAQLELVTDCGTPDERTAHETSAHRTHVELEETIGALRGGHRVVAPRPRPIGRLDARELTGPEGIRPVRTQGDHRDVLGAPLVSHDLGPPPGGFRHRRLVGTVDHRLRDVGVGAHPGLLELRHPDVLAVALERRDQRTAEHVVVRRPYAVLAVVTSELRKHGYERLARPEIAHGSHQRPEQPVALSVHRGREQRTQLRTLEEERGVEVVDDPVGPVFDQPEVLLEKSSVLSGRQRDGLVLVLRPIHAAAHVLSSPRSRSLRTFQRPHSAPRGAQCSG